MAQQYQLSDVRRDRGDEWPLGRDSFN